MFKVRYGYFYGKKFSTKDGVFTLRGFRCREKNPIGFHNYFSRCCRTAPNALSEASVAIATLARELGYPNSAA